jgi:hypothetical protein
LHSGLTDGRAALTHQDPRRTVENGIMSGMDWFPTFVAAAA